MDFCIKGYIKALLHFLMLYLVGFTKYHVNTKYMTLKSPSSIIIVKACQACVQLRIFLSKIPFYHEIVVCLHSYIITPLLNWEKGQKKFPRKSPI